MNNYFKNLIGVAAVILTFHFCLKDVEAMKQNTENRSTPQPTKEVTEIIEEPVFYGTGAEVEITPAPTPNVVETPVPTPTVYIPTEEELRAQAKHQEDLLTYVNENVYHTFANARENYSNFYSNGEASSQMQNLGIQMTQYDVDYVNNNMHIVYDLLNRYVSSYENGNYDDCITVGSQLLDMGENYLDKNTLYQILVSNQLPVEYQGTIDFKNRGNSIYDMYGNIILDNGKQVNIVGGTDDLICSSDIPYDNYNRMYMVADWIKKIPSILLNHYTPLRDTFSDLDVGYFWNQTKVERIARNEWNLLKQNGQAMYGFNPDNVVIRFSEDNNSYVYESSDGYPYGLVNYDDNAKVDYLYDLQDAIVAGEGDVYYLDNAISNMISEQQTKGYIK